MKKYYSNAVRSDAGPLLWISGQVALDKNGKLVGEGDLRAQAVQVLENIQAILADSGMNIIPADDLDDAAQKIVAAVKGA